MRGSKICFHLVLVFFLARKQVAIFSQDTLFVTSSQADSLFLAHNLRILAAEYGIQESEALVISAKMYPNPEFTFDFNIYDPQNNRAFHVDGTGQKSFSIEQLILLGGKRKTSIDIARKNVELAKLDMEDLLRNLFYTLHSSLYTLHQLNTTIQLYAEQLLLISELIGGFEIQVSKGNIPVKELVRLKSVYLKLNNDRSLLLAQRLEQMYQMQVLLGDQQYYIPVIPDTVYQRFVALPLMADLMNSAMAARPDYKMAQLGIDISQMEVKLEKQNAVPDLLFGFSYDQRGGAFNNQVNGFIKIPIPLWSFNKGKIQYAKAQANVMGVELQLKSQEVGLDVNNAYSALSIALGEYIKSTQIYNDDFQIVYQGITSNFKKQNISIIEFVDFIEAYNESVAEVERIKLNLALAALRINYVTNTRIY